MAMMMKMNLMMIQTAVPQKAKKKAIILMMLMMMMTIMLIIKIRKKKTNKKQKKIGISKVKPNKSLSLKLLHKIINNYFNKKRNAEI